MPVSEDGDMDNAQTLRATEIGWLQGGYWRSV